VPQPNTLPLATPSSWEKFKTLVLSSATSLKTEIFRKFAKLLKNIFHNIYGHIIMKYTPQYDSMLIENISMWCLRDKLYMAIFMALYVEINIKVAVVPVLN
jgi:hypothetical protein